MSNEYEYKRMISDEEMAGAIPQLDDRSPKFPEKKPKKEGEDNTVRIIRWLLYTILMGLFLSPVTGLIDWRAHLSLMFILGHFSAQLNRLKK